MVGLLLAGSSANGQHPPTVSSDLGKHSRHAHGHRVIVQADETALAALSRQLAGGLRRTLKHAVVFEVTDRQLAELERNPLVSNISGDLTVAGAMAVTNGVTGATAVWDGSAAIAALRGTGYTGAGIGIAILDSGIARHEALDSRVIASVDLVSGEPGSGGDGFGHGTHVAGIAAGNRTAAAGVTPAFSGGSAPGANLIDVRVLGGTGSGRTSDVIAGIEWVVDHQAAYNIRVMNLSLGHPVTESSLTDPLCQAVERAVAAGIVVVVSAGNNGVTTTVQPVLGGITSPGNAPSAITVGALDTNGTLDTSDDAVAPYSSRGPTMYDGVVKPDVVAPGTRIVSLEAFKSYISAAYPQWHIAGKGRNAYLRLSGTSMSTAVVSGGAALLVSAAPSLTPAQVKLALQLGAHFRPADGLVGAGAGSVDFAQSLKIVQVATLGAITPLPVRPGAVAFSDTGTLIDRLYGRTAILPVRPLDFFLLFQNAGTDPGVLRLLAPSDPVTRAAPSYVVWGNVSRWSTSDYIVWGNTLETSTGQYVVWGNSGFTEGSYVVWGNSIGGAR